VKHEKIRSKRFIREYIESQTDLVDPLSQIDHEQWVKNTCNRCLTGFLYCLTKEDRIVFILRDILSIDYRKMEEIVGLNSVNIRQRIVRIRKRLNNFLERECILANPDSRCKCKIQNFVKEINLDQEFTHIRKELKFKNVYQIADTILPTLEYWKEKLDLMSHSSP
jgi:RNA polymerase sigma-70 factor (ECF subfamily)